ncbi:MAG: transcriptional repressor LexA [Gammaproteobacteria bacterium]|nr:transcriptional repressor LexA [Gammaproteobacteria bacterium]NIM73978.1 transcriptional repressor LexA [Gammaproteobacteria bacterium]NIN38859.1 transcriptional repressor LexA [Gammaproteobacteria bacterium]NIO25754.1 transcriptional repressor LexA [Gammaproteobacteria bacterium]NIO66384.1 transcriptional repressor LexA [Gammaproteobacteria bacterium]
MSEPLTRRQQAILEHLRARRDGDTHPPTLDELCRALGLRSRGSLHKHIQALVEAGYIEPMSGKQRGVRLRADDPDRIGTLPLLGRIAAGRPIEALENPEDLQVPGRLRGRGRCYVLQVCGDSMIDAGILDGDWVVVEQRDHARDGEIVVALIDGEEATLKRIEQTPGACILHAANPALAPLSYAPERVRIQGVVVGQMRAY